MQRTISRLACALALSAVAGACSREPVVIGVVGILTGRQSELAIAGRNGAELRIEEENARGDIRGRKILLEAEDEGKGTQGFNQAVATLRSRGARLIIGPFLSATGDFAAASQEPVLFISPTVSANRFAGRDDPLLRLMASNATAARAIAQYAAQGLAARRVAILRDESNAAYADDYEALFREAFLAAGGTETIRISAQGFSGSSFLELAQRIMESACDALLVIAAGPDAAMLFRQLSRLGYRGARIASGWTITSDFATQGGEACNGVYFAHQYYYNSKAPRYTAFAAAYERRFGRPPSFSAAYGYEAASLAIDMLKKAGPDAPIERLKAAALDGSERAGLQEPWSLDAYGDALRPARVYRFEGDRAMQL